MPSQVFKLSGVSRAEDSFRQAFQRLKIDRPERLPKGTPISQNNVAKEAGCVPSALRKSRFPSLIAEIQRFVEDQVKISPVSPRQTMLSQRQRNRSLKDAIVALKIERDHAFSLLLEADAKILELALDNSTLQARLHVQNVFPIASNHKK
jgi:hypothetical protein